MRKVIVLSGPPKSGKDTLACQFVEGNPNWSWQEMKFTIYEEVAKYFDLPVDLIRQLCTDRLSKEASNPEFGGMTGRQAMIHVAQNVIKPKYGDDYFGAQAARRMDAQPQSEGFVFSDGGFQAEIGPLMENYNVYVVQIFREGCDFSNDSRDYVCSPIDGQTVSLYNDGTKDDLMQKLSECLDQMGLTY